MAEYSNLSREPIGEIPELGDECERELAGRKDAPQRSLDLRRGEPM
jgi:hypothetical protein